MAIDRLGADAVGVEGRVGDGIVAAALDNDEKIVGEIGGDQFRIEGRRQRIRSAARGCLQGVRERTSATSVPSQVKFVARRRG